MFLNEKFAHNELCICVCVCIFVCEYPSSSSARWRKHAQQLLRAALSPSISTLWERERARGSESERERNER